jgi:hypothetical protein
MNGGYGAMAVRRHKGVGERERFWREHVSAWERSGESVRGYCRTRGLSEAGFHFWKRRLKGREGLRVLKGSVPAFAEVRVTAVHEASIEIVLSDARRIHVYPGVDEETLARVIAVLERAGC